MSTIYKSLKDSIESTENYFRSYLPTAYDKQVFIINTVFDLGGIIENINNSQYLNYDEKEDLCRRVMRFKQLATSELKLL